MRKRGVEPSDWTRLVAADGPAVSPDGQTVVFSVTSSNIEEDRNESSLWMLHAESGEVRRITEGPRDRGAVWDAKGERLAFIGNSSGADYIFVMDWPSGAVRAVSPALDSPEQLVWHPDGAGLTFAAYCHQPESEVVDLAEALDGPDAFSRQSETGLRITARFPFRFDGTGYYDARRKHVGQIAADGPADEMVWLTSGEFDVYAYAWHPTGTFVTYAALTDPADTHGHTLFKLTPGEEAEPWIDCKGEVVGVSWSPDGRHLAWVGDDNSYGWAAENQLWISDVEEKQIRNVTATLDRQIGEVPHGDMPVEEPLPIPAWSPDGRTVFVAYHSEGTGQILAVSVATGKWRPLLTDWEGSARSPSASSHAVYFAAEFFDRPPEIYRAGLEDAHIDRVTHFNDEVMAQREMPRHERIQVERAGQRIEGWVTLPWDLESGRSHPLIMTIHGGPHGGFGQVFRHENLVHASQGRFVLQANPRGSQGYGQEFAAACVNDWGGEDFQDLMAILDVVLQRYPVDPGKIGVTGISYGGFMTNWAITHTGRFRAAISEMSVANHLSMFTHSDIGPDFMASEFSAAPWQHWERLWERSPVRYTRAVTTPTLFIAGEQDHRCPPEQTEAMYVALKRRNIPTAYVRFPGAAHGFSRKGRPSERLQRRRLTAAWWDRYL